MKILIVLLSLIFLSASSSIVFRSVRYPDSYTTGSIPAQNLLPSLQVMTDGTIYGVGNMTHVGVPQDAAYRRVFWKTKISSEKVQAFDEFLENSGFMNLPGPKGDRVGLICDTYKHRSEHEACRPEGASHRIIDELNAEIFELINGNGVRWEQYTPDIKYFYTVTGKTANEIDPAMLGSWSEDIVQDVERNIDGYKNGLWELINLHIYYLYDGAKVIGIIGYIDGLSLINAPISPPDMESGSWFYVGTSWYGTEDNDNHSDLTLWLLIAGSIVFFVLIIVAGMARKMSARKNQFNSGNMIDNDSYETYVPQSGPPVYMQTSQNNMMTVQQGVDMNGNVVFYTTNPVNNMATVNAYVDTNNMVFPQANAFTNTNQ